MTGNEEGRVRSLRELPRDIAPPRDLWAGIEARIAAGDGARDDVRDGAAGGSGWRDVGRSRRFWRPERARVFAAAAVIAALAVGIWIGRVVLPGTGGGPAAGSVAGSALSASNTSTGEPGAWHAAYVVDANYVRQRAELVEGLEARLAALPPESRTKVMSSLQTISDSKRDLEAALGKDPTNALLQELLVNTYQDEMRVLTAVHEAGRSGEGI